jgi:metal-sulfur cluster biosynthetic enzyme
MTAPMSATPTIADVWSVLGSIPDPEFGLSIVDLGLIYSASCDEGNVHVVMTLTTPTCPSGGWIEDGVRAALAAIPGVRSVALDMVFDPAWTPAMLSEAGRKQLGWREATP